MDEFQPEDELKPDASDRPAARTRKSSPGPKLPKLPPLPQLPVSKQHIMIAVGILVLLLLILGIGAALKSPSQSPVAGNSSSAGGEGKSIDLSGSSVTGNTSGVTPDAPPPPVAGSNTEGNASPQSEGTSASPAVSSSASAPVAPAQSGVSAGGTAVPVVTRTTLPTAPATLGLSGKNHGMASGNHSANTSSSLPASVLSAPHHAIQQQSHASERNVAAERREREARITEQRRREEQRRVTEQRRVAEQRRAAEPRRVAEHPVKEPRKPITASEPARHESKPASVARKNSPEAAAQVPSGEYTIQLSGATHRGSLDAWARQQNLTGYHVYETQRNGQPWYVLVSGSYATSAEAKQAISTLPEAVRAKSPWVKPLSQVRKEAAK